MTWLLAGRTIDSGGRGVIYSLIVSHPHIDHTRHLMPVMNNFKVKNTVERVLNSRLLLPTKNCNFQELERHGEMQ